MPQDSEKLKTLVNFKKKLEKELEELDVEMKDLTATLDVVNSVLLEKGFKRGDINKVKKPKEGELPVVHRNPNTSANPVMEVRLLFGQQTIR